MLSSVDVMKLNNNSARPSRASFFYTKKRAIGRAANNSNFRDVKSTCLFWTSALCMFS